MEPTTSFNQYIEKSIIDNWDNDALTDYKGFTLQFHDVARKIEKLHIMFECSGVKHGDKIALCGRNSSHWAVAFLAVLTYGAVVVPIQNEFTPVQVHNIVNHSDSKLLFVGDVVAKTIDFNEMPALEGIVYIPDYSLVLSRSEKLSYAREHLNEMFGKRFPKFFRKEHISYYRETSSEELAMINYTSGTTGFSKGVMLPYRALWSNIEYLLAMLSGHVRPGSNIVSMLPMAHMYGLAVEFLFGFSNGCHIYFLTRQPSPSLIAQACAEVHPSMVATVPMVIEKLIRKKIYPYVQSNRMRFLLGMPVISKKVKKRILEMVMDVFGGKAYEVIVAGAPLNGGVESFLYNIGFPLTIAYGTTETAPLLTFSDYKHFIPTSCGLPVSRMEVKVNSSDPANVAGEIIARGPNVMLGYYKNDEVTRSVIDEDHWFHTGDLATQTADGHVFIRGRIKNMLLGSNGQNIYPEEIEDKLNSMTLVNESLVVQQNESLVGLVYPDLEEARNMGFDIKDLEGVMEENRIALNEVLPPFCKLSKIKLQETEFQKTPKKSIKRYLYQNA